MFSEHNILPAIKSGQPASQQVNRKHQRENRAQLNSQPAASLLQGQSQRGGWVDDVVGQVFNAPDIESTFFSQNQCKSAIKETLLKNEAGDLSRVETIYN